MTLLDWHPPRRRPLSEEGVFRTWLRYARHLGSGQRRRLWAAAGAAAEALDTAEGLTDAQLQGRLLTHQQNFRLWAGRRRVDEGMRAARIDALALLGVLAQRRLGLRPFRAQLHAALAMHDGYAVQMRAGEGKTLATCLAAILTGWSGRPCHVVTANDYLAARDAAELAPLFAAAGLTVAALAPEADEPARREIYQADLVYATGKQLLADYLRDQLALAGADSRLRLQLQGWRDDDGPRQPVMRGLYAAIVDEADSVLIDDAMTPLIISIPEQDERLFTAVRMAQTIADDLVAERDYKVSHEFRHIRFTAAGEQRLATACQHLPAMWRAPERREDLLRQALVAREFFARDRHYMLQDEKIVLLDENTGRAMPGRSWGYGLHQAIEAREGVPLTPPTRTLARMSFQRFYASYHRLSGASGTLGGLALELWWTYRLKTLVVASRVPSQLQVQRRRHTAHATQRLQSVVSLAAELQTAGRAVLIGTRRIEDSERTAELLAQRGCPCAVLNAKEHASEAAIIAAAGQPGRITVATNMAGRGTDIKVTPEVVARGGLHVLMFEPHGSSRVDWQLFGRAGRQGDPGQVIAFASGDDELLKRQTPWLARPLYWLLRWPGRYWSVSRGALLGLLIPLAQHRAQATAWRQRRQLVKAEKRHDEQLTFAAGPPGAGGRASTGLFPAPPARATGDVSS